MQAEKRLKDLRDALWQAMIECHPGTEKTPGDPYTMPTPDIVARLAAHGVLSAGDAAEVFSFLDQFDPGEEGDPIPVELPDGADTHMARIAANLRSWRKHPERGPDVPV